MYLSTRFSVNETQVHKGIHGASVIYAVLFLVCMILSNFLLSIPTIGVWTQGCALVTAHIYFDIAGFSPLRVKLKYLSSFPPQLLGSGPCVLFIVLLIILIALILLVVRPNEVVDCIGFSGDTVVAYNASELWPTRWLAQTMMNNINKFLVVDLYKVQMSKVKEHRRLENYQCNETFYSSGTRTAGTIYGLYLVQGTTLNYNITARSGNLTAVDGQLLIFKSYLDFDLYTYDGNPSGSSAFNFSIGASNRPVITNVSLTSNNTGYYFITCNVPASTTFSFVASSSVVFFNYSDFGDKFIYINTWFDVKDFYLPATIEPIVLFAHVYPNTTETGRDSVTLSMSYHRLLPSVLFVLIFLVGSFVVYVHWHFLRFIPST